MQARASKSAAAAQQQTKRKKTFWTTTKLIVLYVAVVVTGVSTLYRFGKKPDKETCSASETMEQAWVFGFWVLGVSAGMGALIWSGLYLHTKWQTDTLKRKIQEAAEENGITDTKRKRRPSNAGGAAAQELKVYSWSRAQLAELRGYDIYLIRDTPTRQIVRWGLRSVVLGYMLCTCAYAGVVVRTWIGFSECTQSTVQFASATTLCFVLCFVTFALNVIETTNTKITIDPVKYLHLLTDDFATSKETATALNLHTESIKELDDAQKAYTTQYNDYETRNGVKNTKDFKGQSHRSTYKQLLANAGWDDTEIEKLERQGWIVMAFSKRSGWIMCLVALGLVYACVIGTALDDRTLETFSCETKERQLTLYDITVTDVKRAPDVQIGNATNSFLPRAEVFMQKYTLECTNCGARRRLLQTTARSETYTMTLPQLPYIPRRDFNVIFSLYSDMQMLLPLSQKSETRYTMALIYTTSMCLLLCLHALLLPSIAKRPFTPCSYACYRYPSDAQLSKDELAAAKKLRAHWTMAAIPTLGVAVTAALGIERVQLWDCPTRSLAFNIAATVAQAIGLFYVTLYVMLWARPKEVSCPTLPCIQATPGTTTPTNVIWKLFSNAPKTPRVVSTMSENFNAAYMPLHAPPGSTNTFFDVPMLPVTRSMLLLPGHGYTLWDYD